MAPHLISDSITRLLTVCRSWRRQNSSSEVYAPLVPRSRTICSTAPSPTFLTAPSPKRMPPDSTRNSSSDALTSGGSTLTPSRRHSPTTPTTFSVSAAMVLNTAANHSTG